MPRKPLTVELPCCPVCHRVGKLPSHITRKDWCNGGLGASSHKAVRMEKRTFAEVIEPPSIEDHIRKAAA